MHRKTYSYAAAIREENAYSTSLRNTPSASYICHEEESPVLNDQSEADDYLVVYIVFKTTK